MCRGASLQLGFCNTLGLMRNGGGFPLSDDFFTDVGGAVGVADCLYDDGACGRVGYTTSCQVGVGCAPYGFVGDGLGD